MAERSQESPKAFPDGRFNPYTSPEVNIFDSNEYLCMAGARTKLMKEVCEGRDHLMANALRSSENFRELMKYTDKMEFKDKKAVILYPGSGFHVAPIAEMGEQLLIQHDLKEVVFVYTEIRGMPNLRNLERALYGLIQSKDGWSTGSSYSLGHDGIDTDGQIKEWGGAFEEVFEIKTPHGIIRIRYKNALSGEDYYLDEDLQRSNFVVVHDLDSIDHIEVLIKFVDKLITTKKDLSNFMVIAEDFTQPPKEYEYEWMDNYPGVVARTKYPYGCDTDTKFELKIVAPNNDPRIEPVDVGKSGLISPKILDLLRTTYDIKIYPKDSKLIVFSGGGTGISKMKPDLSLKTDDSKEKAEDILFSRLLSQLGISGLKKEDLKFKIGPAWDPQLRDFYYYVKSFEIPPQLYDQRLFKIVTEDTQLSKEYVPYEFKKPNWNGAVILRFCALQGSNL